MTALLPNILFPALFAFSFGILTTPLLTHFLYKYKAWKKVGGKTAIGGHEAVEFNKLQRDQETKTPRMGGIVIWSSILVTLIVGYVLGTFFPDTIWAEFNFFSRSQTLIPATMLAVGALLGFLNDFYDITHSNKGLSLSKRLLIISTFATILGWWFYSKLGVTGVGIPGNGEFYLGMGIIPFYVFLTLFIYASGVIDGIDGLSGGVFASIFAAYTGVALINGQYDLATFCAVATGATMAFLWFNVPPARFWMTETGSMALTLALATVVFMTDSLGEGKGVSLFFVIGFLLVATVTSNVLQLTWRRLFKRKLFRIAPLHHHFEAAGWPSYKVTMRYWIISIACAMVGVLLATLT